MKILFWNPTYVLGGGLNLLSNLLQQLANHKGVTSVTAAINEEYDGILREGTWGNKVRRVLIKSGAHLEHFVDGHDAVYLTWPHGISVPSVVLPTVCIFQDTILLDAFGGHTTRAFIEEMERVVRETVAGYTTIIVTSHYTKNRLVQIAGGQYSEKIRVLPHIASNGNLPKTNTPALGQRPYLIYPANISEHKNHNMLFVALSKRRRTDVQLILCGYGTEFIGQHDLNDNQYVNRLNKTIKDRGILQNNDFEALGYVSDEEASKLLDNALGLIMPTRAEGMGLPIHEAIERGIPVITSNIPVLREHYKARSKSILWVDPDCASEIAIAWDTLCENHAELEKTAKTTNQGSGVTWREIGEETFEILERSILNRSQSSIISFKMHHRLMRGMNKSLSKFWRKAG